MDETRTRQEAKAAGARFYRGSPCTRFGHDGLRYVANKACVACEAIDGKAWKAAHRDYEKARKRPLQRAAKKRRRDRLRALRPPKPNNRKSSIARGETTYLGKPCPHGHDGRRYVIGRGCVGCHATTYRECKEAASSRKASWRAVVRLERHESERLARASLRPGYVLPVIEGELTIGRRTIRKQRAPLPPWAAILERVLFSD